MAEFSYQSDVAPYASNLFRQIQSSPFLSSARSTELSGRLLDTMDAARKRRTEFEKDDLATELARTKLDADRLALDDAREELRLKREATTKAPEALATFESILNDPTLDSKQKKANVNLWAMKNADAITRSPLLAAQYRFAAGAAEPDEKPAFTPYQMYQIGRGQEADAQRAEKEVAEAVEKKRKADEDTLEKRAKALESVINSATLEAEDALEVDPNTGTPKPRGFRDPLDRIRILDTIAESDEDLAQLNELPDVDLFKVASQRKRRLTTPSKEPSTRSEVQSLFSLTK